MLVDQLSVARQTALSMNNSVEVRFYQFGDPGIPGEQVNSPSTGRYRAMQTFVIQDSGTAVALGKVQLLPNTIMIDSGATLSSIIGSSQASPAIPTATKGSMLNVPIPRVGTNYNSVAFQFLPGGSTNLTPPISTWFLTLHKLNDADGLNTPPSNFYTVQIDASNGHIKTYRP
jgi:uncharacterized protein (TIGR02596 family)